MATQQALPLAPTQSEYVLWRRYTALTALLLLTITILVSRLKVGFFPLHQIQSQDVVPLFILSISLLVAAFWTPLWSLPEREPRILPLFGIGVVAAGLLAFGTYAVMGNFPLSIDERLVLFDMSVFNGGHLATPLAAEWRPYTTALVPAFLLNQHMPTGLVSSYLPMNALLRLAFSKVADPVLFNPLLALAGGVALFDISRRLFARDTAARWVVLLVYALSAQMLVNAMTVYSMTGHMALNMIWLAAFLRGGRTGHSVAIATGFVATGLHQLVFHPLFVAPFLLWKLLHRDWKLVLLYGGAYATIVLWWLYYPVLAGHEVASAIKQVPHSSFISRIATTFAERRGDTIFTTFCNLLRFVAWQNLALLPLLSAAVAVAMRERGFPAVLLLGIASWMLFITIVIPFQGFGWGYRYLHPYLGSFALLAGYGYRELKTTIGRRADGLVLGLSYLTAAAAIPTLLMTTHRSIAPYVSLERLVARQQAPMVLVDTFPRPTSDGRWAGNAIEIVRNRPDLTNRPLRFSSLAMTSDLLAGLCRKGKVALVTSADQQSVGFSLNASTESPSFGSLVNPVQEKMPDCFGPPNSVSSHTAGIWAR